MRWMQEKGLSCRTPSPYDEEAGRARHRWANRTKPPGSLGILEDAAVQLAAISGRCPPEIRRPAVVVAGADHGVVAEGVSAFPADVTRQMMLNFAAGGAAISVLARRRQADIRIVDAGVTRPPDHPDIIDCRAGAGTANMTRGAAMTREQLAHVLDGGAELAGALVREGTDIIALGEMGIGNTTAASAVSAVLSGRPPLQLTGPGAGLDDAGVKHKAEVISRALAVNRPDAGDPLDVLRKVGGFEIAFLTGVILAAVHNRLPVVIDGFICSSAALCASRMMSGLTSYLLAGHRSAEPGHDVLLDMLDLQPLLDLQMRLGEGTGAAVSLTLIEDAVALLAGMASFSGAGVSESGGGES